jgi:radical SAM superfamily enzyme YgiQ (UPF0313 family)
MLMQVADLIYKHLPSVKSIGGYARVDNVRNKTVEQLRELAQAGYSNFYFGNESGDDALLDRMDKGYHGDDVVSWMSKLDEAGMPYILNFLGGLGGLGYGLGHARKSAEVINQLNPTMVYASELTLFEDTPLSRDLEKGTFEEATEEERYEELAELIRCIHVPTIFKAEHVTLPLPIRGKLPEDRDAMVRKLEDLAEFAHQGGLTGFRQAVYSL